MTYPDPSVQSLIAEQFVPLRLVLQERSSQEHFRAYQVIWTPTIVLLDRRGAAHYQSPGFLPPALFLAMLGIGLARSLIAWSRYDEAANQLSRVGEQEGSAFAPEALYWLGVARYLKERKRAPMMQAWNRLRAEYPASIWAARIPPNQEQDVEP